MTENEWLNCTEPKPMLELLRGKASERRLRLFACACCRTFWSFLPDLRSREAVEAAERYADGVIKRPELQRASGRASNATLSRRARFAMMTTSVPLLDLLGVERVTDLIADKAALWFIRDIFSNSFRPVTIHPDCLTPTVTDLAIAAYEERSLPSGELDTTRLAILADALEESGCDNADILTHLRGPGPHVRGCWVVDLLLAKK
jgi:hypothetical protein